MVIKSFRGNPNKPGTVGNGPQAGGIAKSAGVMQSSAIALLAGLRVGFIDADSTIALHLLRIAESGHFAEWLGAGAAIPKLRAAAKDALKYTPQLPAEQLTNTVLTAYDGLQRALHKVLHAHTDADCIRSAREAQHYDREYRAARA